MLSLLLLIPLLGAVGLGLWPGNPDAIKIRRAAIALLVVQLLASLRVGADTLEIEVYDHWLAPAEAT